MQKRKARRAVGGEIVSEKPTPLWNELMSRGSSEKTWIIDDQWIRMELSERTSEKTLFRQFMNSFFGEANLPPPFKQSTPHSSTQTKATHN